MDDQIKHVRDLKQLEKTTGRMARKRNHDTGKGGTSPVIGPSASFCKISPRLWKSKRSLGEPLEGIDV